MSIVEPEVNDDNQKRRENIAPRSTHVVWQIFSKSSVQYPLVPRFVVFRDHQLQSTSRKKQRILKVSPWPPADYVHAPTFFAGISLIVATMSLRGRESSSPRLLLSGLITLRLRSHLQGRSPPFPPSLWYYKNRTSSSPHLPEGGGGCGDGIFVYLAPPARPSPLCP